MRAPRRFAALAVAAVLAAAVPGRPAGADPAAIARLGRDLDDDRFETRRRAELELEAVGISILAGGVPAEDEAAWERALDDASALGGSPAAAVHRILRRLETRADDGSVARVAARMPRLLRARLERILPQLVLPRRAGGDVDVRNLDDTDYAALDAAAAAGRGVRGLLPEARPALLAVIARSDDPRVVAGAIVALCGEEGEAPTGDDVVTALLDGFDRAPATLRGVAGWYAPGGLEPVAALALALAVTGRGADLASLRGRGAGDADVTLDAWLRQYVATHGYGELDAGTFLVRVEEGSADADVEREAARRALDAGVPWLARLLARRALFLRPGDAAARAVLADAYERVGMRAAARAARGEPPDDAATDDAAAVELDDALREGRLSSRILFSRELGETPIPGLAPVVLHGGRLLFGGVDGSVGSADAATGDDLGLASTAVARLPRAVLVSDGTVFALTGRGELARFELDDGGGLVLRGRDLGPFLAAAAGDDGDVWLVARGRKLYRRPRGGAPEAVKTVPSEPTYVPRALARTSGGKLLLRSDRDQLTAVDPATGTVSVVVPEGAGLRAAAAFGADVLVAFRDGWARLTTDGKEVLRVAVEDGADGVGIGGDPVAGRIVWVAPDRTICFDAAGKAQWQEQVGGSGNPDVRGDHVAIPAGTGGRPLGDGREDRTVYVLRLSSSTLDPFAVEARVRAVEAAVTAVVEDRDAVAIALLDPLRGWLTATEAWGAETALRQAQQQRDARKAPPPARSPDGTDDR
ncbi:MAG: PQQ-like beta-propeller repeat protein [Planctomycetia bacterium]|nr:PQQ-like beta-propeller repeat protein [Planctomycetia bacterium]